MGLQAPIRLWEALGSRICSQRVVGVGMGSVARPLPMTSDGCPSLTLRESAFVPNSTPRHWGTGWHMKPSPCPCNGARGSSGEVGPPHRWEPTPSGVAQDRGEVKMMGVEVGLDSQGRFLEEGAFEMGLAFSSAPQFPWHFFLGNFLVWVSILGAFSGHIMCDMVRGMT